VKRIRQIHLVTLDFTRAHGFFDGVSIRNPSTGVGGVLIISSNWKDFSNLNLGGVRTMAELGKRIRIIVSVRELVQKVEFGS